MKVLVAAASRHGSTEMIADCIREELEFGGCDADLIDPDSVASVREYDAVVLGSAVYAGHWLKPARKLADRLEPALRGKPVWLFSSGPVGGAGKAIAPSVDGGELARRLGAREHRVFPGRIEPVKLSTLERWRVRGADAEDDDRDWLEVGRWARSIAATLRADEPTRSATPAMAGRPA